MQSIKKTPPHLLHIFNQINTKDTPPLITYIQLIQITFRIKNQTVLKVITTNKKIVVISSIESKKYCFFVSEKIFCMRNSMLNNYLPLI